MCPFSARNVSVPSSTYSCPSDGVVHRPQRIDGEGEPEPHAICKQLAAERERIEHQLQRKAHRHADDYLLRGGDEPIGGQQRERCRAAESPAAVPAVSASAITMRSRAGT